MPYCLRPTSQVVPVRKLIPWSRMPGTAFSPICHRMKARSTRMLAALAWASPRNARSATRSRGDGAPAMLPGTRACSSVLTAAVPSASLHARGGLAHGAGDALGQGDVAHLGAGLLALGQAVVDHLSQRGRLLGVRVLLVEEQPRVG